MLTRRVASVIAAAAKAHPPASHNLHSDEYCAENLRGWYHHHGYTCQAASDEQLRLFDW